MLGRLFLLLVIAGTGPVWAEDQDMDDANAEIQGVEAELERNIPVSPTIEVGTGATPSKPTAPTADYEKVSKAVAKQDIAVIQRNYMPKSDRYLLSGGITWAANDQFYDTFGLNLKASYHFTERWGAETFLYYMTSSPSQVTKDLETKQFQVVSNLVTIRSYYGVSAYFNSIYGKTSLWDRKIVPFEIYQTIGIGSVQTIQSKSEVAFHIGMGELWSLDRSRTFRLDLSWVFYASNTINGDRSQNNTLFVNFSFGKLFPEATYR